MRFEKMDQATQLYLLDAVRCEVIKSGNNVSNSPAFHFIDDRGCNVMSFQRGTGLFMPPPKGTTGAELRGDGWYWTLNETKQEYKDRLSKTLAPPSSRDAIRHIMEVCFTGVEYEYSMDYREQIVTIKVGYDNPDEILEIMRSKLPAILLVKVVKI